MIRLRRLLASPFYGIAFCAHLLCAAFTFIAERVAGEHPIKHGIATLLILGWSGFIGVVAAHIDPNPPGVSISQRELYWNIPSGYSPETLKMALPAVRANGCMAAHDAVRTALKTKVGFNPCVIENDDKQISISDDLQDATVSGFAQVGDARRPFTVKLQHYPPAIWTGGFIVLEVNVQ